MKKLRISHFPQVPCNPYRVEVENLKEAKKIMNILAEYDYFQLENNIKPDYSNVTVLEMYDEENKDWVDWEDEETGIDDLDEYIEFISEED